MQKLNIRVYRVVFPDGVSNFAVKNHHGTGKGVSQSLKTAAVIVKHDVSHFLGNPEEAMVEVLIDLSPSNDIEFPIGLQPRLCFSLTEEERNDFWKYFNEKDE